MSDTHTVIISSTVPVIVIVVGLFIIAIASLSFFIYWKRRRSSLPHLDKHHKESEENSYSSSKNSRDSSPKGGDSFNPVYDEIKLKVYSHPREPIKKSNRDDYISCNDDDELDYPHYSTVYSKVSDQQNKEHECCRPNHTCTQLSRGHKNSNISHEEIEDQSYYDHPSINSTNDHIDKDKSEHFETHTYALVDPKKKKTEDSTNTNEACTPGSDGGTPPPLPPHTPEMLLNDSDPNRHDERPQVESDR